MKSFGEPLRPVLMRSVRRDSDKEMTFLHIHIEVARHEFGLDMVIADHEIASAIDPESLFDYKAREASAQIASLLKPWLMDMIKKNVGG